MGDSEGSVQQQLATLLELVKSQGADIQILKSQPSSDANKFTTSKANLSDVKYKKGEWSLGLSDDEEDSDKGDGISDLVQSLTNETKNDPEAITPPNCTEDELAEILKSFEQPVEFGNEIDNQIAEGMNTALTRKLNKDTLVKLTEKFKVPVNCKSVTVPKINVEIWNHLPASARLVDLRQQQSQQGLSIALIALANIADKMVKSGERVPQDLKKAVLVNCVEASNVLGDQLQDVNSKRRLEIRKFLNPEYSAICSAQTKATEWLFGSDLNESLKASKTSSTIVRRTKEGFISRFRPAPYTRPPSSTMRYQNNLNSYRPFQQYKRGNGQRFSNQPRFQNPNQQTNYRPQRHH